MSFLIIYIIIYTYTHYTYVYIVYFSHIWWVVGIALFAVEFGMFHMHFDWMLFGFGVILCDKHINIPKYCNNFLLLFLLDSPFAVIRSDDMAKKIHFQASHTTDTNHHVHRTYIVHFGSLRVIIVFTYRTYSICRSIPFFLFKILLCISLRFIWPFIDSSGSSSNCGTRTFPYVAATAAAAAAAILP